MKHMISPRTLSIMLISCLGLLTAMVAMESWVTSAHIVQQTLASDSSQPMGAMAPPTLTSVSPTQAYNYHATAITIFGGNFVATPTATVGNVPLADVTFVDSTTLTGTVPTDLPGGEYTLMVTNPDSQSASLVNALTVHRRGDGSLGSWQSMTAMSTGRNRSAVVQVSGYVYALGGRDDSGQTLNSVERAEINADGSLGPWQTVAPMTTERFGLGAVAASGYLYALGGLDRSSQPLNSVERAEVNADGSLGPWQTVAPMTTDRFGLGAVAVSGYLYALGGSSVTSGQLNSVERAVINTDGSLGPWEVTASMIKERELFGTVAVGRFLYALGGQPTAHSSVERAEINADGSLGPWRAEASMIMRRSSLGAVAVGGYLYALGGWTGYPNGSLSTVERATINADGSLGHWQVMSAMTSDRHGLGAVAAGGYIYALGGTSYDPPGLPPGVERAAISPPTLTGVSPLAISAHHPTAITITGVNFLPTPTIRLGGAIPLTVSFVSTDTLTATIPAGLASGWYTAMVTNPDGQMASLVNALLVDDTVPTAESLAINGGALDTTSTNVTLTVSASDPTDGVAEMSFSNDGSAWSDWQPYSTSTGWSLPIGDGLKTTYGRFRDTASNVSSVVSDTIELDTAAATDYGLTINDGDLFTNKTTVMLTINAQPGTAQVQVSNDGGFSGAEWEPYATHKAWEITQYGSYVIPRTVYVRYKDVDGNMSATYQDDIILDVTAPDSEITELELPAANATAQSAINAAAQSITVPITVRWAGTDDVSGVKWYDIQVRTANSQWTEWLVQTTDTQAVYQAQPGRTYYFQSRAQDNAGNWEEYPGGNGHQSIFVCPDFADPPGVDVKDIQVVVSYWHKQDTDPGWEGGQQYDLDEDGDIDVTDIMRVVAAWGPCL